MSKSVFTGIIVGIIVAMLMGLRAVGHALPPPSHKPWSEWTLTAKKDYVTANLHHARFAIAWIRSHRHLYRRELGGLIAEHRALERKARANLAAINAKLHPPFRYPWWWVPLGVCETGSNPPDPAFNGGGYEGWINFLNSTWLTYGGGQFAAHAYDATEYEQYVVTMRMHADVPWSQSNPACSAMIGM